MRQNAIAHAVIANVVVAGVNARQTSMLMVRTRNVRLRVIPPVTRAPATRNEALTSTM